MTDKLKLKIRENKVSIEGKIPVKPYSAGHTPAVEPEKASPLRARLLRQAENLTVGPRNAEYGPPVEQAERAAAIFNAWAGRNLTATEISQVMVAVKLSRMTESPRKADHYADTMAYVGIVAECVEEECGRLT